jgi:hypothetical protein
MNIEIKVAALLFALSGLVITKSHAQNTNCNVTVQFATVSAGGFFAPNHVLAVWVETAGGQFVRSLKVLAVDHKENLYTWLEASSDNTIDAITGSTKTEHGAESVVWNGKDTNHLVVPDGDYKVLVEFTEEHVQGPLLEIPFTKNITPSDSTFTNAANYTNISIDYALNSTSIDDEYTTNKGNFGVYPNPFSNQATVKIWSDRSTNAHLSI